jgi:hypothetical protein
VRALKPCGEEEHWKKYTASAFENENAVSSPVIDQTGCHHMPPHATKIRSLSEAPALLSVRLSALTVVNTRNIDKMGNTMLFCNPLKAQPWLPRSFRLVSSGRTLSCIRTFTGNTGKSGFQFQISLPRCSSPFPSPPKHSLVTSRHRRR